MSFGDATRGGRGTVPNPSSSSPQEDPWRLIQESSRDTAAPPSPSPPPPPPIPAQATLNPGDSIDLPIDALRNNLGENVLVDTLRWTIDVQQQVESADPPTSPVGFPGAGVTISMRFGDKPLTGGEVPIYCLGPAVGQDVETSILGVADDTTTEMLLPVYLFR